ncbi:efflux RND transporter periplasmic adaptor subunit [Saccharobesus litoralis]|uniref:Efflux RND transporter periplasmic adaptor subunit n=1 Tax=Saccharobesus litoralis TaxID=2172099 RepID=A0A2S0VXG9_9ALTE|nr:efflux RND transporter periplasmic adaptor subunit [Saccharobesus litoralis]AWB68893.1 efflux RND transporter periplasmic adaptor subunit [Saccharobesus litoralis]
MYKQLTLLLACFVISCSKQTQPPTEHIRPIDWMRVQATDVKQVRRLSGQLTAVEATHLSFEVSGKVATVFAKLGDKVKKGEQLAQLEQKSFNLSLQSAQARYEQAQASQAEARNTYKRYADLVDKGMVSQSGFDNAKAAFEASNSAVEVAKAQLNIAKKNLDDSLLSAPYNGVITKRLIEPSQHVNAGIHAFEIEGNHGLEAQVMVPENLIQKLENGSSMPINIPAFPQLKLSGVVTEIGTRAELANAFPVTLMLQQSDEHLRAGMTAEVDITYREVYSATQEKLFKVPVSAIGADIGQSQFVYVYDPEKHTINKRTVKPITILNNEAYLAEGLKDGDIIAIAGVAFLRNGQTVSLLEKQIQLFN